MKFYLIQVLPLSLDFLIVKSKSSDTFVFMKNFLLGLLFLPLDELSFDILDIQFSIQVVYLERD